jgi:hypothetical protein
MVVGVLIFCSVMWYFFAPDPVPTETAKSVPLPTEAVRPALPPVPLPDIAPANVPAPVPSRDEVPVEGDRVIAGTVEDQNGDPVVDARVIIEREDWEHWEMPEGVGFRLETGTDDEGAFRFENLPEKNFHVVATKGGQVGLYFAQAQDGDVRDFIITLQLAESISGTVVDAEGRRVMNAVVIPVERDPDEETFQAAAAMALRAVTGEDGLFELPQLAIGHWKLVAKAEGYAPVLTDFVATGQGDVEIVLAIGGSVSGEVLDANTSEPVADVTLLLSGESDHTDREVTSDSAGQFHVSRVTPGDYTVSLEEEEVHVLYGDPPEFTVLAEEELVDLVVLTELGGAIAGRVFDADTGLGIAGVTIHGSAIEPIHITIEDSAREPKYPARLVESDADGNYRLEGLGDAKYTVYRQGELPGYQNPDPYRRDHRSVKAVPGRDIDGVDFPIAKGLRIAGRVIDSNGRPLEDALKVLRLRHWGHLRYRTKGSGI